MTASAARPKEGNAMGRRNRQRIDPNNPIDLDMLAASWGESAVEAILSGAENCAFYDAELAARFARKAMRLRGQLLELASPAQAAAPAPAYSREEFERDRHGETGDRFDPVVRELRERMAQDVLLGVEATPPAPGGVEQVRRAIEGGPPKLGTLGVPMHLRREPTQKDFDDPRFDVLWELMKRVDVDFRNGLFSDATGNDVCAVLDALDQAAKAAPPTPAPSSEGLTLAEQIAQEIRDGAFFMTPDGWDQDAAAAIILPHLTEQARQIEALQTRVQTCKWCGHKVVEGAGGHSSGCYERQLNDCRGQIEALTRERNGAIARAVVAEHHKTLELLSKGSAVEQLEMKLRTQLAEAELQVESLQQQLTTVRAALQAIAKVSYTRLDAEQGDLAEHVTLAGDALAALAP